MNQFPITAPTLGSDGFILRPIQSSDADPITEYMQYSEYYCYVPGIPLKYTRNDADTYLEKTMEKISSGTRLEWAIVHQGVMVGTINLHEPDFQMDVVKVGYLIAKPYWGQGIATRALRLLIEYCFNELKVHRIQAEVYHPNIGSARVLEKAGFTREGQLREARKSREEVYDLIIFGLLSHEYVS